MLTFKHQTWLKCQTSLQGLNASKCKVSWVPTDFNQAPASTREMKLSLQLCLPMKGQVGLQGLTVAWLQSPPEPKGKPLTDFNSIWTKPQAFVPYWNPFWNSIPSWFAAGSVRLHFVYIFMCGERRALYSSHWLFSRTCFHFLLTLQHFRQEFSITSICFRWNYSGKRSTRTVQLFLQGFSYRQRSTFISVKKSANFILEKQHHLASVT